MSQEQSSDGVETSNEGNRRNSGELNPEAREELRQLRMTLQNNIQTSRMQNHAFEPLSLPGSQPVSRAPSGSNTPHRRSMVVGSNDASPKQSPVHSPPLTPASTRPRDANKAAAAPTRPGRVPDAMTPQRSSSPLRKDEPAPISSHPKEQPSHSAGASGDSLPVSKDVSPSRTPGSGAAGTPRTSTPFKDAKTSSISIDTSQDLSQSRQTTRSTTDSIESRFRFANRDPAAGYSNSGSGIDLNAMQNLPRLGSSGSIKGVEEKPAASPAPSPIAPPEKEHHHGSKSNLKRFFKFGGDHKHKDKANGGSHNEQRGAPSRSSTTNVPFADDHGLETKYGKFGKILGSGAGGSVRLMKRSGDGVVFAVKQFRERHMYESEREYNRKVTAEFCIGSTLHHGNVIETIDIVHEKGNWYEVMEYAPYDLFATVMTGKMTREEVTCTTLQILSGVLYLHSMGLAHRDLKLDNVVINEHGIMKLIDFGSAAVFRYPFENEVVFSTGIVGSDPYLAPEVYEAPKYDPRMTDVWSIAICFCCMILRRFPWKSPKMSDNSFRLFVSRPDPEQDKYLDSRRRSSAKPAPQGGDGGNDAANADDKDGQMTSASRQTTQSNPDSSITIKGPVRLLRLLPRETRHIIGRMLELDPRKRATMDEILQDPWVQNSLVCQWEENGKVISAPNHKHHLQPSGSS